MIAYFKRDEPKIPAHRRAVWDVLIGLVIFFSAVAALSVLALAINAVEDASASSGRSVWSVAQPHLAKVAKAKLAHTSRLKADISCYRIENIDNRLACSNRSNRQAVSRAEEARYMLADMRFDILLTAARNGQEARGRQLLLQGIASARNAWASISALYSNLASYNTSTSKAKAQLDRYSATCRLATGRLQRAVVTLSNAAGVHLTNRMVLALSRVC